MSLPSLSMFLLCLSAIAGVATLVSVHRRRRVWRSALLFLSMLALCGACVWVAGLGE